MPLQIECACGHKGTVPDEYVGREIRCPRCKTVLVPLTQDKMENFAARVLFAAPSQKEEAAPEIISAPSNSPEITYTCPFCRESYPVSVELAGKAISCRNCREPGRVDEVEPEPKPRKRRTRGERRRALIVILVALLFLAVGILLGRLTNP